MIFPTDWKNIVYFVVQNLKEMTLTNFFWGLGNAFEFMLSILDENVGFAAFFNTTLIILGFFGMFYWLRYQLKFNKEAKNNPDQIK